MKKLSIPCDVNGKTLDQDFYVGLPAENQHPIAFQASWFSESKGGSVPQSIMKSLEKLLKISKQTDVPFEDLCEYAFRVAKESDCNLEEYFMNNYNDTQEGEEGSQAT